MTPIGTLSLHTLLSHYTTVQYVPLPHSQSACVFRDLNSGEGPSHAKPQLAADDESELNKNPTHPGIQHYCH